MGTFNTIPHFKFWCQKVLPLVYDDSLSYMELLCKVIAYLNHIIDDVNQIPEIINSLISDEKLEEIMSELLDDLREQIARANEGTNTTASYDRNKDELVWLNGKLAVMTRDILAGDRYIEESDPNDSITGNFMYTSVEIEMNKIKESISDLSDDLSAEITNRENADTTLQGNIDAEATARENTDTILQGNIDAEATARGNADSNLQTEINKLNHNPVNVLTLGFDPTGETPNDELFAEYTANYDLYFPAGTYLFTETIHPKHSIYGVGNTWGWESDDNNQFSMLKCSDDYVIEIDEPSGDLIVDGFVLNPNFVGGGLKLSTSTYSTNVFKNITVINTATRGFSIEPSTLQSRCFTIDSCIVFGMGQVATIGYYISANAPDCRITNSYSSQIQVSIRCEANILTLANVHTWSGIVTGTINDAWYINTKGLSLRNCTLYATNLYLDTHFIPIYSDGSGRSKVFIDNISIWYDNSIAGTTKTDGSLAYGPLDVYIDKGLIYPSIYLPYVGAYDNVKMTNVVIKTDETFSASNWQKFPLTPSNNKYEISNNPSSVQYVEVAAGRVNEWGISYIHIYDNYGNDVETIYKNIEGTVTVAKKSNNGGMSLYYKITDNVIKIYKAIARYSFNNVTITGSSGLRFLNYNLVTRNDNTPYTREALSATTGLTEISEVE